MLLGRHTLDYIRKCTNDDDGTQPTSAWAHPPYIKSLRFFLALQRLDKQRRGGGRAGNDSGVLGQPLSMSRLALASAATSASWHVAKEP